MTSKHELEGDCSTSRQLEQGQQSFRKSLRLLPTLLLWLSLVRALIQENNSNDSNTKQVKTTSPQRLLVSAATAASNLQSRRPLHQFPDDGGALEIIDDHHSTDDKWQRKSLEEADEEQEHESIIKNEVIVVVAVDGTMAGICKETGQVLWKHSDATTETVTTTMGAATLKAKTPRRSSASNLDAREILHPLVSTTTTTKSASTANYAVVPSIDGTVFTTSNDMTVSTSVKDLVARSPFLDPRGRFYVGSTQTIAAALDIDTGEILRVLSAASSNEAEEWKNGDDTMPTLNGRNVVWIGRVDYSVTVQDARTGVMEAQFSVSEVMSVSDMHGIAQNEGWIRERLKTGYYSSHESPGSQLPATTDLDEVDTSIVRSMGVSALAHGNFEATAALVATPNGNVAFYDVQSDRLSWVTDESFDSPIAFAMDATTGRSIGVDIIADVVDPNRDSVYLRREMERQLISAADDFIPDEQTIVGAMPNGQLYALPLRLKATTSVAATNVGAATRIASTSSSAAIASSSSSSHAKHSSHVSQLPGRANSNFHDHWLLHPRLHDSHQQNKHSDQSKHGLMTGKKPCIASSPTFPSCLVPQRVEQHRHQLSSELAPPLWSGQVHHPNSDGAVAIMTSKYHKDDIGFYHPDFGYVSPENLHLFQQRTQSKSYKKLFLLLTSWLPPTILCIFVASFELGRRKRLRDEKRLKEDSLVQLEKAVDVTTADGETTDPAQSYQLHQKHVISVSDEVLGFGGHGTVVYKGVLDGRDVAVKRMLKAYHASADREISLLIESDGDPNVVRYFLKEVRGDFVYLALELCDLSLHDLIGVLREYQQKSFMSSEEKTKYLGNDTKIISSTKRILLQIASGVKHLHSLRIVHRDLKPANILCAISNQGKKKRKSQEPIFDTFIHDYYDAKISDMGLGKQLVGQSSIGASLVGESSLKGSKGIGASSVGVGPGSVGWQAPEVMAMRVTSDKSTQSNDSGSIVENKQNLPFDPQTNTRTSRSVDIFSLGCIFYSLLIPGCHPFGEWFEREANIMHNRPNLEPLKSVSVEAYDLVKSMLERDPKLRPTAKEVCRHPLFWESQKKLLFLSDFSDRLETDSPQQSSLSKHSLAIERGAVDVVGTSWEARLDEALIDNVQKFRSYDYSCVRDLLRLIRNKHHHFDELPDEFRASTVPNQDALCEYFEVKFPELVMHCFHFCRAKLKDDDVLMLKYGMRSLSMLEHKASIPVPLVIRDESKTDDEAKLPEDVDIHVGKESAGCMDYNVVNDTCIANETVDTIGNASDLVVDDNTRSTILESDELSFPETSDLIIWEGSVAAKAFNCRGWSRSDDEWSRHIEPQYKKRDPGLKRCMEDPKFRTRLCNHWDVSLGTYCPMKKKNKCIFAHGPAELRVKEGKKNRWGKLVDKNGNNSNPWHSGGEDTFGPASTIEKVRKEEGKWSANNNKKSNGQASNSSNKKRAGPQKNGQTFETE